MRLLHFSDLAVDAPISLIAPELRETGHQEVRAAFQRICELARELDVDALCCAGNLFDESSVTEETAQFLRDGFASIQPVPVLVAPGSTDWHHPTGMYARDGFWSANVHIFSEARLVPIKVAGLNLWGAAHTTPFHGHGLLDDFSVDGDGPHVALFHGGETSLVDPPATAPFSAAQIARAGLDHALVGHHLVAHSAADYTYPGRAAPRAEVARTAGGAVLVTVDHSGSVLRQWHDVLPVTVSAPAMASSFQAPVRVPEPVAVPEPERSDAEAGWLGALFDPGPDDLPDLDEIARERTVRGEFVRRVRRADLGEDEGPVLRAGLLALEGRLHADADHGGY